MKVKAKKVSIPSKDTMRLVLLNEMRSIGKEIKEDFDKTVETWDKKPDFKLSVSLAGSTPSVTVETIDEVYKWVDEGTKAHWVEPVNAKVLAFRTSYQAKTSPGVIGSGAGGASGDMVFSKGHEVSGIKARKFSKKIQDKWKGEFGKRMASAMKQAAKASGHGKG